jgi:hypothetical protein
MNKKPSHKAGFFMFDLTNGAYQNDQSARTMYSIGSLLPL